ncbi:MAG: hypothetical protein IKL08_05875 [Clostridia bacterium]|nr:hypothetical protein [Clostridia bacterium]
MDKVYFEVIYQIEDPKGIIKWELMRECMKAELMRVYDIYADKSNSGITEQLNKEFEILNPNYFENNKGKEWHELTEYNKFMADGYQRLILDEFNKTNISSILDFGMDPEEVYLIGYLKVDHSVKISFTLKEVKNN